MKKGALAGLFLVLCLVCTACQKEEAALPVMPETPNANVQAYLEKATRLQEQIVTEALQEELGNTPAGEVGHAVFFSVCDTTKRAEVYHGTGQDLAAAWDLAVTAAAAGLQETGTEPTWVKADVVYTSEMVSRKELREAVTHSREEFFRYGVAFDQAYQTALLEAELNGAKIYEYEEDGIDLQYLNNYLTDAGLPKQRKVPRMMTLFRTFGWFCGANSQVSRLDSNDLSFGRRVPNVVDAAYAKKLIRNASDFLIQQIKEDGSFVYGYYPRFDKEIENYNIVRHASTIWSLLCRYRLEPSEALAQNIEKTIGYLLSQVRYADADTAYLYEEKEDEIKLGGCGLAVVALTEYKDIFQSDQYDAVCRALGNGILKQWNAETGEYYHVLHGDFSQKEAFRTVYYDGEATFALCRLYGMTGEEKWLTAAKAAVDHFIEADYTQYKDHWVAYTMNEITKYVTDNESYYAFALRNVKNNLQEIYEQDTTYHTYLELLMASFELYDRMLTNGASVEGFPEEAFLKTIYTRAERMLNGYFYPEYAMYMQNPQTILNTFMVRHDGYRVRIDDVQHNIGGYYLYAKNYERLLSSGMLGVKDESWEEIS